jgi:hypothetical protein
LRGDCRERKGGGSYYSSARKCTQPSLKSDNDSADDGAGHDEVQPEKKLLSSAEAEVNNFEICIRSFCLVKFVLQLSVKLGLVPYEFISIKTNILQKMKDQNSTEPFNASCPLVQYFSTKNLIST